MNTLLLKKQNKQNFDFARSVKMIMDLGPVQFPDSV